MRMHLREQVSKVHVQLLVTLLFLHLWPVRHGLPVLRKGQVPLVSSLRLSLVGREGVFNLPEGDEGHLPLR